MRWATDFSICLPPTRPDPPLNFPLKMIFIVWLLFIFLIVRCLVDLRRLADAFVIAITWDRCTLNSSTAGVIDPVGWRLPYRLPKLNHDDAPVDFNSLHQRHWRGCGNHRVVPLS